ncbi:MULTISPECIES: PilX N-terminal domain-containing pilus assembly protein [Lysobacteraceae]|nr:MULTISPECIES: PilX N-terminal domain-containing pilus assembly protein [Lysobacter]
MTRNRNFTPQRHARGNALLVAVILLLLASVITLLTLNVGLFEQRSSGNDARAKIISEVAEAGVSQGAEYFRLKPTSLLATSGNWARCIDLADKTQFPCGSIPDAGRRDTMYYWVNGSTPGDVNGDGISNDLLDQRMLPLGSVLTGGSAPARITTVGNFNNVAYGVGVVLCRIALPTAPGDPTRCTTVASEQSSTYVYNFVSIAGLGQTETEGTRTTVSQMLGQYQIFQPNMNMPPVIASGSVDVTGGLQLVTNPNGGGPGVPVSVWTRKDITKTGTPNTCYADEFYRYGAKNNAPPTLDTSGVVLCDTCGCNGDVSLSYDKSGNQQDEGMDILDVDGSTGTNGKGVNADVVASEFPCDLFGYVFGVNARMDTNGDFFCETLVPAVQYTSPTTMATVNLDADEAFLYKNATYILPRDGTAQSLMDPSQTWGGGYPSSSLSGIVWCQTNCNIGSNTQVGTPAKPVVLVIDGNARIQGRVFGLVFMRTPAATPAKHPLNGAHDHTADKLDPATGGTATLDMNAGATVYGAVVVQGKIDKANGTAAIIYSGDVFKNFAGSIPPKTSNLPGAWTDRLTY